MKTDDGFWSAEAAASHIALNTEINLLARR